jgi:hypothetical protein
MGISDESKEAAHRRIFAWNIEPGYIMSPSRHDLHHRPSLAERVIIDDFDPRLGPTNVLFLPTAGMGARGKEVRGGTRTRLDGAATYSGAGLTDPKIKRSSTQLVLEVTLFESS